MKRLTILLALIIGVGTLSFAQEVNKHNIEVGVGTNALSMFLIGELNRGIGVGMHTEYRYAHSDHINFTGKLLFMSARNDKNRDRFHNQIALKAGADLNIRPSKRVCPYVGLAAGGGFHQIYSRSYDPYATVGWRFGVQVGPIRTSLESDLFFNGGHRYSLDGKFLALNVGYTF